MSSYCAVVPHYQHASTVGGVVGGLRGLGLEVLVIDDGSAAAARRSLRDALGGCDGVHLLWRPQNDGKGAAVKDGLRAAWLLGHTHALQVDADGQHTIPDAVRLIEASGRDPDALVCALPVFGCDAPRSRLYGRKLTNFWVAVETWSRQLKDAMCGFRVYPLAPIISLLATQRLGDRMDFDIEVLVRAWWAGVKLEYLPTPVSYPADGVSHFLPVRDNVHITLCHGRLVFGMLPRSPVLLRRVCSRSHGRRGVAAT